MLSVKSFGQPSSRETGDRMTAANQSENNSANIIWVTPAELPLACPMDKHKVWNQHPRVFLTVAAEHPVQCPYCGNRYQLKAEPSE